MDLLSWFFGGIGGVLYWICVKIGRCLYQILMIIKGGLSIIVVGFKRGGLLGGFKAIIR